MGTIYVAKSMKLGKWASDVGLSKHVFKVGYTEGPVKDVVAAGWAGESDWQLVKKQEVESMSEDGLITRLALKVRMVDPALYPKIKGARGIFKVAPDHVENHIVVERAMAGVELIDPGKLKPADFAKYLIENALK
jgi:hypothetical protein